MMPTLVFIIVLALGVGLLVGAIASDNSFNGSGAFAGLFGLLCTAFGLGGLIARIFR